MKHKCLDSQEVDVKTYLISRKIVRKGYYFRHSDGRNIRRYYCRSCFKSFSMATGKASFGQKKRKLNYAIYELLNSGVSQRRAAKLLNISRNTVASKLKYLAARAQIDLEHWLKSVPDQSITEIQFDDLETSIHSKLKPVSVALAIEPKSRKILGFQVSQMPAKGHLAKPSIKKYGYRQDLRSEGWNTLFKQLTRIANKKATWISDQNPHYPKHLMDHHPQANHVALLSRRGCVVGQGELKKIGFDPLFSLNHTCAMFRANLNRLFRKTWCTSKTIQGLSNHLIIYVKWHNERLTPALLTSPLN